DKLSKPQPFRNLVAQIRSVSDTDVHNRFFSKMLAEFDTPSLPYGLSDVHRDGLDVLESHIKLPQDLNNSLRGHAKRMGVSLAKLLEHEHASLAQAQRCSSVPAGTPLFSVILNYRHNTTSLSESSSRNGWSIIEGQERTNYPFAISVEDGGNTLGLTAQAVNQYDPSRICGYMHQALQSLAEALDHTPKMQVRDLMILPDAEREMLIQSWNNTTKAYPDDLCIHHLFENQVKQSPDAIAVVYEDQTLTYHELNLCADRRAIQLSDRGVKLGDFVATILERSFELIVTQIATLKLGAIYVPIDPKAPMDRQSFIINDCGARLLVTGKNTKVPAESEEILLRLTRDYKDIIDSPIHGADLGSLSSSLDTAYAMYTSGSTGAPK
ncbi:hypothetical protein BGX26_007623, partial [Mortierella sp. AD094]